MTPAGSAAPFRLLALDAQKPNEVTLRPGANCAAQGAGVTVTAVPDRTKLPSQVESFNIVTVRSWAAGGSVG